MIQFAVQHQGNVRRERTAAFGVRTRRQQHATHVRMHNDWVGRFVFCLGAGQAAALQPVFCICLRILISDFSQAQRLHADTQARRVHHHEHAVQATVRFTDHPAGCTVEIDLASGIAMDAHFFFDCAAENRVARTELAIGIRNEFWYDKQRNALGTRWRIRQACEHQMNDIGGQIMLASRNKNFAAR